MFQMCKRVRLNVLIILGLLSTQYLFGQIQKADSLQSRLYQLKRSGAHDTVYLTTLNEYIFTLQYLNPDSALILGEFSKSKSDEIGFKCGYLEAVRNIGIVYYLKGNFVSALENFYDALKVAESINNKIGVARIYNNIALIYYGEGKYNEALENQMKSLAIKKEIDDKPGIATSLNNIANIYKNLGNYSESLKYHKQALEVKRDLHDKRSIAASLNNIGWLYLKQNNSTEAFNYFKDAESPSNEAGDKVLLSDVAQGLAECFLNRRDYNTALRYANKATLIAQGINLKDQLRDCNETLSRIYKAQGKFERALYHFELYKIYADSINSMEVEKRTASLTTQYEFEKREAQLTAQHTKDNAEHEKKSLQQRWILFSVLMGFLSVSVIAFLISRSRDKIAVAFKKLEEASEEINRKSEELRDINIVLMKQKSEVIEQRDLVTLQNKKLQEISATLEAHKHNLEFEVEKRTIELKDYARRIEQFAFFTAHDLRAPVATILGLANLLSHFANSAEEKQDIFEKMVLTTQKLDCVVKQLNNSIDERNAYRNDSVEVPVG